MVKVSYKCKIKRKERKKGGYGKILEKNSHSYLPNI